MKKITQFFVHLVQRYLPDPFIFCILLTVLVYVLALGFTSNTPVQMLSHWYDGFWSLLSFSMQMVLVLVTGFALANAPFFKRKLEQLADKVKKPYQAILLVSIVGLVGCIINWGFGLIVGAIFAKELAKKVDGVDYPLLIASAYSGFLVWHGGLSGSIPLSLASGGDTLKETTGGAITESIGTVHTIFSLQNITIMVLMLIVIPLVNMKMHPAKKDTVTIDKNLLKDDVEVKNEVSILPSAKLENSRILSGLIVIAGIIIIVVFFRKNGFNLGLDIVNFIFLILGLFLHKTPIAYVKAIQEGISGSAGIVLQFPFYAGIMGMMGGAGSDGDSLGGLISIGLVNMANEANFNVITFLNAGVVNFFIPSGGGQWAIQAPIILPAAQELGVDPASASMAIAWGDAWTNMVQPFWALPALGIAKLNAKDIMGYCIVDLIVSGLIIGSVFYFL
ncbi:MAG: short-chain fatty acid transporter [Erysipelotrichales bacterium]